MEELIRKKDALHAVLHNQGDAAVAAVQMLQPLRIVRCKDCLYAKQAYRNEKGFLICDATAMDITDDDFCSYGELKGGEHE